MKNLTSMLALCAFFTCTVIAQDHSMQSHASPFTVGSTLPTVSLRDATTEQTIDAQSADGPVIVVRFLGYSCSHCVRQLTYLNEHANVLAAHHIRVVAFSTDAPRICERLMIAQHLDPRVFTVLSDPDAQAATAIGAVRREGGTDLDLHATLVVDHNTVRFARYTDQPYMDVEAIVAAAVNAEQHDNALPVAASTSHIDNYLHTKPMVAFVAGADQGISTPLDLAFNTSVLHPNDVWVVMAQPKNGNAMAIIHNAGTSQMSVRIKKDSRAYHFMWRTQALDFGSNGAFATAENGQEGNGSARYMFMGPTLWSADTSIFASKYQESDEFLASHLDMLHQSPQGLGIVHEQGNAFWVLDNFYHDLVRYDFQDPHEVGGVDHRDGIIRRYRDVVIGRATLDRAAHIAIDHTTNFLYYIDPVTNSVHRLDITSGSFEKAAVAPPESEEDLAEFSIYAGARVDSLFAIPTAELVGMAVFENRLLLGDQLSGNIYMYDLSTPVPTLLGTIATGALSLQGITVGPDHRIWFVDKTRGSVNVLATQSSDRLSVVEDISYVRPGSTRTIMATLSNSSKSAARTYSINVGTTGNPATWTIGWPTSVTLGPQSDSTFAIAISSDSLGGINEITVQASVPTVDSLPLLSTSFIAVVQTTKRMCVNDATTEVLDPQDAVRATGRTSYVSVTADLFNRIADSLTSLETVLWYSGSFGEITATDESMLASLKARSIETFLIADDPLLLRSEEPAANTFFDLYGIRLGGAEVGADAIDDGRRVYRGKTGDPISAGMVDIDCQLPRLDHHRGGKFVPSVRFTVNSSTATSVLQRTDAIGISMVRSELNFLRMAILGINPARVLLEEQRTALIDKTLTWLEGAKRAIPTNVLETTGQDPSFALTSTANPFTDGTTVRLQSADEQANVFVALYNLSGIRLATLHEGSLPLGSTTWNIDGSTLSAATYFVIARTADRIVHITLVKR